MSWSADDAMYDVVERCIDGFSCKDIAERYLKKQIQYYEINGWNCDYLKEKLDALQNKSEVEE